MRRLNTAFVAYSDNPASIGETIETAISKINHTSDYKVESWKNVNTSGHYVIDKICEHINKNDIFVCELTTLNFNVLFELGYAIAKLKSIWLLLDTSIDKAKSNFDKFGLFSTIGYNEYTNSDKIMIDFLSNDFSSNKNIFEDTLSSLSLSDDNTNNLFYIKSPIDTEASIKLSRLIEQYRSKHNIVNDDPSEVSIRPFSWYVENVINSCGIIAHFLSDAHKDAIFHNAKSSFVCGLAYGLDIPVLMLAHYPFECPIDYKNLLTINTTAIDCESTARAWFAAFELNSPSFQRSTRLEIRARNELQKINLGDILAENETSTLLDYYVKTSSFDEALRSNHSIFIGRKGCGKTANLIKLADELNTPQNHVCVIKPVAYELEGILQILNDTSSIAEKGYLIESLWKFLIYTELSKSVYLFLKAKPTYYDYTDDEIKIIEYVDKHSNLIMQEFSARLDYAVCQLNKINSLKTSSNFEATLQEHQLKVSELLHNNIINTLRELLGVYFFNKKKKIAILVDNLDKAWGHENDIANMSAFIFGLLDVGESIVRDFSKEDRWRQPANLTLIIFLRDDIYVQISKYAVEKDKLPIKKILWQDPAILLRVIEERMSSGNNVDVWEKYFCPDVNGQDVKAFIIEHIIPRPRDIIYLVNAALNNANSRKHAKIEAEDLVDALDFYSRFAFDTLITEIGTQFDDASNFLFEFAGSNDLIDEDNITHIMDKLSINSEDKDEIIKTLCCLSFLGVEVDIDRFEFIYDEDDFYRYNVMSNKTSANRGNSPRRFKIHKAFHAYLEIKSEL